MQTIEHPVFSFAELSTSVLKWANDRNIFHGGTPLAQLEKTQEELTETRDAVVEHRLKIEHPDLFDPEATLDEIRDGIGDTLVTLIIVAQFFNMTVEECLAHAYEQIKDRKGTMINGTFVKEA